MWRWTALAAAAVLGVSVVARGLDATTRASGSDHRQASWTLHIERVEDALARRDISTAEQAWHDAYIAALRSRGWEGMVETGNAALRISRIAGARKASEARAREIYLAALFRARHQMSLDGVRRVAEAFAALGDGEGVEQCLRVADDLAGRARDGQLLERMRTACKQMAAQQASAMAAPGGEVAAIHPLARP